MRWIVHKLPVLRKELIHTSESGGRIIFGGCRFVSQSTNTEDERVRHPLDAFFENGQALPNQLDSKGRIFGRAWSSDELRCKSFEDLHRLWFVLMREVNLLATQRAEARRNEQRWVSLGRHQKCRLSMARLKGVLVERSNLYQTAISSISVEDRKFPPVKTEGELLISWQKSEKMRQLWRKRAFRRRMNYRAGRKSLFV